MPEDDHEHPIVPSTSSPSPSPNLLNGTISTTNPIPNPEPEPDSLINPTHSLTYWTSTPATLTGILGGYPQISLIDLRGSKSFLNKLRKLHPQERPSRSRSLNGQFTTSASTSSRKRLKLGLDAGAGIGRVTDGLLRDVCEVVDVVEPVQKFVDFLEHQSKTAGEGRLSEVFVAGLETWPEMEADAEGKKEIMEEGMVEGGERDKEGVRKEGRRRQEKKYDLIWNQWCLGHLTDHQLVDYLKRCAKNLTLPTNSEEGGWIIVKENLSTSPLGQDIYDDLDSSVTRTDEKFRTLFEAAGLSVLRSELQTGFPKGLGLFPVRMYGLRPRHWSEGDGEGRVEVEEGG